MLSLLLSAVLSQGQPVLIADPKNLSKRATISTSADGGQGALNVHVVPSDTALTAFGETRVSTPYTLFDMGSGRYGRDSREVSSIAGDGGTVTDVLRSSGFTLSVPGGNTAHAPLVANLVTVQEAHVEFAEICPIKHFALGNSEVNPWVALVATGQRRVHEGLERRAGDVPVPGLSRHSAVVA